MKRMEGIVRGRMIRPTRNRPVARYRLVSMRGTGGRMPGDQGVTLVELMVVVTIIAIIAAIAVAVFQEMTKKAKLSADQDTVGNLRSAVALYYGRTNGGFPADISSLSTLITPAPIWQCNVTPTYDSANGKVTFTATIGNCP
jgi:type IV pilus assembly protein PilA